MKRGLIVATLLSLPIYAQFDRMVTSDDGSVVLFQSGWRLAGSNDGALEKIFRWDTKGFSLIFSPQDTGQAVPPSATDPFISGAGTIFGFTSSPGCAGSACATAFPSVTVTGASVPAALPMNLPFQLSRNGRFLAASTMVADLTTGKLRDVAITGSNAPPGTMPPSGAFGGRFGLGDNGGLLMLILEPEFILSTVDLLLSTLPGVTIVNSQVIFAAVVSASENRVVYEIHSPDQFPDRQLWNYEVATGKSSMLEDQDLGDFTGDSQFQPSISNDGSVLLYRRFNSITSSWEAVAHEFTSGNTTVLGAILPSDNNLVISGDGQSAWLHSADGQLACVNVGTAAADVVPGRHVWISQRYGAPVYGSYNHLFGGGFAADNQSTPAKDLTLTFAGLPCPILKTISSELDLQFPWEAPVTGEFLLVLNSSSSPFESLFAVDMVAYKPTFERSGLPGTSDADLPIIVAHQDFRGVVTPDDPAVPGEILHFYMTGLADAEPRPLTGQPPSELTYSVTPQCFLSSDGAEAQAPVEFAGLAPGLIGIYQLDLLIPASYPPSPTSLLQISCFDTDMAGTLAGDSGPIPFAGKVP